MHANSAITERGAPPASRLTLGPNPMLGSRDMVSLPDSRLASAPCRHLTRTRVGPNSRSVTVDPSLAPRRRVHCARGMFRNRNGWRRHISQSVLPDPNHELPHPTTPGQIPARALSMTYHNRQVSAHAE